MKKEVGKIKNLSVNEASNDLEMTVKITDPKFKKKILRDLSLLGYITFEVNKMIYVNKQCRFIRHFLLLALFSSFYDS